MDRCGSDLIKNRFENNLVIVTAVFFSFNAIKPWVDIFFGISNQLITGLQLILLLLSFLYFSLHTRGNMGILTLLVLIYVCLRYFAELQIMFFSEFKLEYLIASTYSAVRIAMFFLFLHVLSFNLSRQCIDRLKNIFLSYFIYTFAISALQHPLIFDVAVLRDAGGNVVSGNGLGIFRSTGGIGGTVIGYANYLLAVFWIIFYGSRIGHGFGKFVTSAFIFSVVFCFSRSMFLSIFIILFLEMVFRFRMSHYFFLSILLIVLPFVNFEVILDGYRDMIRFSDFARLEQWRLLAENLDLLTFFMGNQVGENTGLHTSGMRTISGDSFLLGTLNDFGLIGLALFIASTIYAVRRFKLKKNHTMGILATLFLMLMVNSGFLKLTIMFSYVLALSILKGLNEDKPDKSIQST